MKECPQCGYIIENDNAKFCRKCGTKQPQIAIERNEYTVKKTTENEGVLLNDFHKQNINDDGGLTLSPRFTSDGPISNSYTSFTVVPEEKDFLGAVKTCFRKYATFKGRASRSEYWYFYLFNFIISTILFGLAIAINQENISLVFLGLTIVYTLGVFLPCIAAAVRRLHDIGKSGWLYCVIFIPCIGVCILLYFLCKKGDEGNNP